MENNIKRVEIALYCGAKYIYRDITRINVRDNCIEIDDTKNHRTIIHFINDIEYIVYDYRR